MSSSSACCFGGGERCVSWCQVCLSHIFVVMLLFVPIGFIATMNVSSFCRMMQEWGLYGRARVLRTMSESLRIAMTEIWKMEVFKSV